MHSTFEQEAKEHTRANGNGSSGDTREDSEAEWGPLIPNVQGEALDIFAPDIKQNPRLDLLTEVELEAFNGWYATMRKPRFSLSHEEATLKSWELLIESMESMHKRGGGRWANQSLFTDKPEEPKWFD